MASAFLGEIRILAFGFPPSGWALCNGQVLPINQNQALFAILGTTYGGDGQNTFALPNLQGRAPMHATGGFNPGAAGGEANHTLALAEMPAHTHTVAAAGGAAAVASPAGNLWANGAEPAYGPPGGALLAPEAIGTTGGGQAHANMQPYLAVSFAIALQGIFPSQN